jgi:hypothetical protein
MGNHLFCFFRAHYTTSTSSPPIGETTTPPQTRDGYILECVLFACFSFDYISPPPSSAFLPPHRPPSICPFAAGKEEEENTKKANTFTLYVGLASGPHTAQRGEHTHATTTAVVV